MNYDNFVNVDNKFWICKYQVTQKEYFEIVNDNPSNYQDDNNPVECVNLYDAINYCNNKSITDGLEAVYTINGFDIIKNKNKNGYRLPTPEEWLYAAKGGSLSKGFIYSGSNNPFEVAWFSENSNKRTHNVGTKKPNELGIYDMSGNVWERTDKKSGLLFGGAWSSAENDIFINSKRNYHPSDKLIITGFRCVLSI